MYMCCLICLNDEATTIEDCFYNFMKYYPTTGWYVTRTEEELNEFLDKHRHGSLLGEYFQLYPESRMPGFGEDKAQILKSISEGIKQMQEGDA